MRLLMDHTKLSFVVGRMCWCVVGVVEIDSLQFVAILYFSMVTRVPEVKVLAD